MTQSILIAYYSLTGTTRKFAEAIHAVVDGDLFAIEMLHPYPKVYSEVLKASKPDWQNKVRPPLKHKVENIAEYSIVFIGSPNWFSTMAPPVFSFLEGHDLSGKKIIPFLTHGGGGISNSFKECAEATPESIHLEGLAISRNHINESDRLISEWLKDLDL
ncbi:MAG: flavodoxin [Anaerolineae bacterium]|jgi:flavodoxin|nr:flavodoxin [Anaerolineae bacterium]